MYNRLPLDGRDGMSMMASGSIPTVSVVMPVYNEAAYAKAAIESVLRQTLTDLELVLVDNGSTDATPEILRQISDPRVRLFRNERNLGSAVAGNQAVRNSKAALIARMDADDIALPHRLAVQVAAFAARPELALLGGQVCHVDQSGRTLLRRFAPRAVTPVGIAWQSLFGSPFIHSTTMFRRESFEAAGGYDERMQRSADFALFSRIQATGCVANLPDVLTRLRHLERPVLHDDTYDRLVRAVIAENARRYLGIQSADEDLALLITAWPEYCLWLRGAQMPNVESAHTALSGFISAFRDRFRELHPDPAGDREIALDVKFVRCVAAWDAISRRREGALRLARDSFIRAPLFAAGFFARRLADRRIARLLRSRL